MPTPTYTPLATKTLTASTASITFSSISQSYRDLVLVSYSATNSGSDYWVRFNGDTATNYSTGIMSGESTFKSYNLYGAAGGYNSIVAATSAQGAQIIMSMLDYSATDKHKSCIIRSDKQGTRTEASCGRWASNAAINNLTITQYAPDRLFQVGSTFTLYGIAA